MAHPASKMPYRVVADNAGMRNDGLGKGPENAQLVGGFWMPAKEAHFPDVMYSKKNYRTRDGRVCYQYHKYVAALQHVKQRRVAIDIGSHIGFWSVWLAKDFQHVMCFEPMPEFYRFMPWNMESKNYTLFDCALGNKADHVALEIDPAFTGGTHIVGSGDIQQSTLDSFQFEEVDFIKIDVEGYELPVIQGGEETIKKNKPVIICEQKGNEKKHYGWKAQQATKLLESWGMKTAKVISGDHIMVW